jgi:hypothetical protein
MLYEVLRLVAECGQGAVWIVIFFTATVATFVLYVGIAMWAAIRATDPEQGQIRYQVFSDLVKLFDRRRRG